MEDITKLGIEFLKDATNIEEALGGYSGAKSYFFTKGDNEYFIKIGTNPRNCGADFEQMITNAHITHPAIIEFKTTPEGIPYIIEEKAKGVTGKSLLLKKHEKYFYEYGFIQGKEWSNIKQVYPDRPITQEEIIKEKTNINKTINEFYEIVDFSKLTPFSKQIINVLTEYIKTHENAICSAIYTYGHPDLKLSNLLIDGRKVISIDFQSVKYNNVARSAYCSLIRRHYEENEKHWAYVSGYLDGLYNCNVPDIVYDNLTLYLCLFALKMFASIMSKGKWEYVDTYCAFLSTNFLKNNTIDSRKLLGRFYEIRNIKVLDGYTFSFVAGSYDPNSFVFRCDKQNAQSYFLKIRRGGKHELHRIQSINTILNHYHYPCPPMKECGLLNDAFTYSINTFIPSIPYPEVKGQEGFEIGEKLGAKLASYHLSIRHHKDTESSPKDVSQAFFDNIMQHVHFILDSNSEYACLYPYTKEQTLAYLEQWKQSYAQDQLYFTHADLKMGNVLYDGKEMYIVDLANFGYGYELHNFTYSLYSCLSKEYPKKDIFSGWIRGYLKGVYGYLPTCLQDEARAIMLFQLVRVIKGLIDGNGGTHSLQDCLDMVDKYITKGETIEWLQ